MKVKLQSNINFLFFNPCETHSLVFVVLLEHFLGVITSAVREEHNDVVALCASLRAALHSCVKLEQLLEGELEPGLVLRLTQRRQRSHFPLESLPGTERRRVLR